MKKPILLLISLFVLAAGFYVYKMYNKEHTDIAMTEAAETITASDLFNTFDTDEAAAMVKYSDQVVQVSGNVTEVDLSNDNEPQIVIEGNGDNGFIRCGFKPTELSKVKEIASTNNVSIKGMCMGLNGSDDLDLLGDKDVVLSNCIIID
jgi:hypothetical protein